MPAFLHHLSLGNIRRRLLRGHFYDVTVTSAADYDLYGEIAAK